MNAVAFGLLAVAAVAQSGSKAPSAEPVPSALSSESYPWYDSGTDRVKPVLPAFDPGAWGLNWLGEKIHSWLMAIGKWFSGIRMSLGGSGDVIMTILAVLALAAVILGILELIRRFRPLTEETGQGLGAIKLGLAERIEGLPVDLSDPWADPWAEVLRLRAAGDYAGASVYLFAHQLLTLNRLGQIRLVPGRTARQLVGSLGDRELRSTVAPALRLFESVYYGHRPVSAEEFAPVWSLAQAFEARFAGKALA